MEDEDKDGMIKITFVLAFVTYFIGDLVTTYFGLKTAGFHEGNIILSRIGFEGTILLKILFFIGLFGLVKWFKKRQYHEYAIFVNGIVFGIGFIVVLLNIRFYQ